MEDGRWRGHSTICRLRLLPSDDFITAWQIIQAHQICFIENIYTAASSILSDWYIYCAAACQEYCCVPLIWVEDCCWCKRNDLLFIPAWRVPSRAGGDSCVVLRGRLENAFWDCVVIYDGITCWRLRWSIYRLRCDISTALWYMMVECIICCNLSCDCVWLRWVYYFLLPMKMEMRCYEDYS